MKKARYFAALIAVAVFLAGAQAGAATKGKACKASQLKVKQAIMKTVVTEDNAKELMGKVNKKTGFTSAESMAFKKYMIKAEIDAGFSEAPETPAYVGKTVKQVINEGKTLE